MSRLLAYCAKQLFWSPLPVHFFDDLLNLFLGHIWLPFGTWFVTDGVDVALLEPSRPHRYPVRAQHQVIGSLLYALATNAHHVYCYQSLDHYGILFLFVRLSSFCVISVMSYVIYRDQNVFRSDSVMPKNF